MYVHINAAFLDELSIYYAAMSITKLFKFKITHNPMFVIRTGLHLLQAEEFIKLIILFKSVWDVS
jgi:hypothetical protein